MDPKRPVLATMGVSRGVNPRLKNRPFLSYPKPLFTIEAICDAIYMKTIFYSPANKTHFHRSRTSPRFKSEGSRNSEMAYLTHLRQKAYHVISSLNTKFFEIWLSVTGYGELCVCF